MTRRACSRTIASIWLATAALTAQAQDLKPGLWEQSTRMRSDSGQMEQAMAQAQQQISAMPPEQRKMMQEMMAKQGMAMGSSGPGNMVMKICMTPEMVARNAIPTQEGDCKSEASPRSGNTMRMKFSCTQPPSSGEGTVTFVSPQSYSSQMTITTRAGGKPETMRMETQGRWLAADCGNVQPPAARRK